MENELTIERKKSKGQEGNLEKQRGHYEMELARINPRG